MGVSIIGIITVQGIWMHHAVNVKNELFTRSVVDAMQFTLSRIEKMRDAEVITRISLGDSTFPHAVPIPPPPPPHNTFVWKSKPAPKASVHKNISAETKMNVSRSKSGSITINTITTSEAGATAHQQNFAVFATRNSKNLDSLFSEGIVRIDSLVTEIQTSDSLFNHMQKKVEGKAIRLKHVANNIVTEIITSEEELPDLNEISEIFATKLEEKNIPIDFELGILNDSIIENRTDKADSLLLVHSQFKAKMFPHDIFERNLVLSAYFPGKDRYIYQTIGWLLAFSLALSLLILFSFSAGIFFLLRQKKISEMKSDFINNMTHEFKTPIATIAVATDSVLNEKVISEPERIRYFMSMIKKENSRMNRQVEDILTIARLDKKDFEFHWELVNAHELIEEAVDGIRLQIETKGGKIETRLAAINPIVTCDRTHCANVLYNLLDNAMKYSSASPVILVETRNESQGIVVAVEDNGIGMNKIVQSKIFDKFYRQTSGNIHTVKGFGLGLSYAKAVIESNHGHIHVKSEPGKGSRFEVFVPFVR